MHQTARGRKTMERAAGDAQALAGSQDLGGLVENAGRIQLVSPTVLQSGSYRFFFFSSDRGEPVHIHVSRDQKMTKFWLEPVRLEFSHGFAQNELNRITALVNEHRPLFVKAWHDFFGSGN